MRQSKEIKQNWTGPKHFDICFCLIFNCYDKSFISGMETGQSRTTSCIALLVPKQNYIKMWCSIVLFHKFFWKYMSIMVITTIINKIFETNSNFHVKQRITGKVQFLFFNTFFASINKIFFFSQKNWALGYHSMRLWDFLNIF